MTISQELQEIRASRKEQSRNERAATNALDYRDGYAAAFADYTGFREASDIADGSLTPKEAAENERNEWANSC